MSNNIEDIKILESITRPKLAMGFKEQTRTLQAIENIKHVREELNKDKEKMIDYGTYQLYKMFSNDLDIVLNLIEKQNKEIAELKERIEDLEASLFEAEEFLQDY